MVDEDDKEESELIIESRNIVWQNVLTVEDDREQIPVIYFDNKFTGLQFAIVQEEEILAITSLQLEGNLIADSYKLEGLSSKSYKHIV